MNIKTCFFCQTGVAFKPITNARGEIISTHSLCRNESCPQYKQNLTVLALKKKQSSKHSTKSLRRSKKTSRTSAAGNFFKGGIVMISSLVLTVLFCGNLAKADSISNTVTYQQTVQSISTSTIEVKEPVSVKPESIHDKLTRYALKYDIPRQEMHDLVQCEVGEMFNPNTRSQGILKTGKQENSWGLSQINLDVHDVKKSDAIDPDFALDWLGSHWSQRHSMYVNCTKKLGI